MFFGVQSKTNNSENLILKKYQQKLDLGPKIKISKISKDQKFQKSIRKHVDPC